MIAGSSKRKSSDSRGGRILIKRTCCRRGGTGHEVNNHAARSYALQVYGKQEWETDTRWSKEDTRRPAPMLERDTTAATPAIARLRFARPSIRPQAQALYSAAAINRPLAPLRHLLRFACGEWEVLSAAPRIRLERESQG